ncbi:uncharacterized protein LOC117103891 [Anneissia japonica]|uniref:uncharacterized protein LOC117103891 n=1 Tax=Anneissia japonica TaxID=1529436 RepID=UPI0014255CDE|nr:uncharacterized protein LOC117103891 [Anneissia japonica]
MSVPINTPQTNASRGPQTPPPTYDQLFPYSRENMQPVDSTSRHLVELVRKNKNYLLLSIFVTIIFCSPFGIIGIIYSVDGSRKLDRGDNVGALNAVNLSKLWSITGLVVGLVIVCFINIIWWFSREP